MKKNILITMSLLTVLGIAGCGNNNSTAVVLPDESVIEEADTNADAEDDYQDPLPAEEDDGEDAPDVVTDEQAIEAVRNYVSSINPDAIEMEESGDHTVYFALESSTGEEIVVMFRSYTASETRFYINRATGETKITEYVPGITDQETETGESFNIKNFMGDFEGADAAYSDDFLMNYTWSTASMVVDENGNAAPEWDVRFGETTIDYGHMENDQFVLDHSDKITLFEQYSEHSFKIQAETSTGGQYTYQTSASDENVLEYYWTWNEAEYPDSYSGGASLVR